MAWTSNGCMPQNSAICSKVSAVFSISHTAVALGISGRVMAALPWLPGGARRGGGRKAGHMDFGGSTVKRRNAGAAP